MSLNLKLIRKLYQLKNLKLKIGNKLFIILHGLIKLYSYPIIFGLLLLIFKYYKLLENNNKEYLIKLMDLEFMVILICY